MKGRKPKPTIVKLLAGNPGKAKLNKQEPKPRNAVPDMPDVLDELAQAEWNRIVPELAGCGLLSQLDRALLSGYCVAWSRWVVAEQQVREYGTIHYSPEKNYPQKSPYLTVADNALAQMHKLAAELGLSASSRTRIKVPTDVEHATDFEKFVGDVG